MTIPSVPIEFRFQPFVCGAIGAWEDDDMSTVVAAAPGGVTKLPTSDQVAFFTTDPGKIRKSAQTLSWESTGAHRADDGLAAGISLDSRGAVLYTDPLGLTELYFRRLGDAVFFASRIDPLLSIGEEGLDTDWAAWADLIAFGYPVGDRTPFLQVRRMTAGTTLRARPGSAPVEESSTPFWASHVGQQAVDPGEMAAIVAAGIPRIYRKRPIVLLSGGWDSRMLAGLVSSRSLLRPVAWTTSPDDGWDDDIAFAGPVARSLRLQHRIEVPDEDAFHREATETRRRLQYQTYMHTWLSPLARRLQNGRAPLVDGLAGDVLLKSLFVSAETASINHRNKRMRSVWESLSRGSGLDNGNVFTPELRARVVEASWSDFERATDQIPEQPGDATLAVLLTRTMRGISSSPLWVFGPENDVRLPFVSPAVISAALGVPIASKASGDYYRRVLAEAAAPAASLPSTNDGLPKAKRGPRRQSSEAALAWMASLIRSSEDALGLLTGAMRTAVLDNSEELTRLSGYSTPLRMIQIASLLAGWQSDYGSLLSDVGDAPWRLSR